MNKPKKALKNLKKKVTLFALIMISLQPVVGLLVMPVKTFASGPTTLVSWNFDSSDAVASGGIAANSGKLIQNSITSGSTSFPSGFSGKAISHNNWQDQSYDKYWNTESVSTAGYNTIKVSSKQKSSTTGPQGFVIQYKVGLGAWNSLVGVDTSGGSWVTTDNVSLPDSAANQSSIAVRWLADTNASNGGGTSSLDDVVVTGVAITPPAITINNPNTLPAKSKTVTASTDKGTLTMSVNSSGVTTCNGTLTFVDYVSTSFENESDNDRTICYRAVDGVNTTYSVSNPISGIDTTAPVVSGVENGKTYNSDVTPVFDGVGHISKDGGIAPVFASGTTLSEDGNYVLTVNDEAGNQTIVNFTIDKTSPTFIPTVAPKVAGPGVKTVEITVTSSEGLKTQDVPVTVSNQRVYVAGPTYEVKITINDQQDNPLIVYLSKDSDGNYKYSYDIGSYVGKKTVTFDIEGTDLAGNKGVGNDSFEINNAVLSPSVPTVTPAVATTAVSGPETPVVQNDFSGSEQGEVKADTTIKADDQKKDEGNQDDKKTETKDKKSVPLWGIIFLLVLAGIGGYLFYTQNPNQQTTKKK